MSMLKKEKRSIVKNSIDYIVRYTGKPAMAQSRIINYDGNFVTFYYDRHEDGKRVTEKLSALDFIKRLIIHIPKMVRYYGLYAKKHRHSSKFILLLSPEKKRFWKRHSNWRARILIILMNTPRLRGIQSIFDFETLILQIYFSILAHKFHTCGF